MQSSAPMLIPGWPFESASATSGRILMHDGGVVL